MKTEILPSLLAADFGRLSDEILRAEASGAEALHLDIMDAHFVPNLSFGPDVVALASKTAPDFHRNVHLMMTRPDLYLEAFAKAGPMPKEYLEKFVLCLAPFAPHLGEELWAFLGHDATLAYEPWPVYDAAALVEDEIEIPVQVLGKLRGRVRVPVDATPADMEAAARANEEVAKHLEGKTVVKVIAVPKRMVNFVVR